MYIYVMLILIIVVTSYDIMKNTVEDGAMVRIIDDPAEAEHLMRGNQKYTSKVELARGGVAGLHVLVQLIELHLRRKCTSKGI